MCGASGTGVRVAAGVVGGHKTTLTLRGLVRAACTFLARVTLRVSMGVVRMFLWWRLWWGSGRTSVVIQVFWTDGFGAVGMVWKDPKRAPERSIQRETQRCVMGCD